MRNISNKSCRGKQNAHFAYSNFFPRKSYRLLDNVGGKKRYGQTGHMRFTCWIPKATNIHSEYVILIAFPLQEWLQERVSLLSYTFIACNVRTVYWTASNCGHSALHQELRYLLYKSPERHHSWSRHGSEHTLRTHLCKGLKITRM
jgi:hypothetical protein